MILAIAVAFLQIRAIPQTSLSAFSAVSAETVGATAPTDKGTTAVPLDSTETANSASTPTVPTPARAGVFAPGRIAGPVSLPHIQDPSERLRQREWLALSIAQHSAATFDAWSTRRVISSGRGQELNPTLRPFAGNVSLYAVVQVGPIALDYLGRRMMTSQHDWARRTWWIPQVVSTMVLVATGAHNMSVH
jgi:hypothetical protein